METIQFLAEFEIFITRWEYCPAGRNIAFGNLYFTYFIPQTLEFIYTTN